jgi:hypothetical protein
MSHIYSKTIGEENLNVYFYRKIRNTGYNTLRLVRAKFNPLSTKRKPLYLSPSSYCAVHTFQLCYKNQSVYAVGGTSRCLFPDKYKTHKYRVGRAYSY